MKCLLKDISYANALIKIHFPQAYSILTLVGAKTLFVADRGRLVGLITWSEVSSVSSLMCLKSSLNIDIIKGPMLGC